MQAASVTGSENIVRLLLNKGADINARGGIYGTALQAVLAKGYETIARLLVGRGNRVLDITSFKNIVLLFSIRKID